MTSRVVGALTITVSLLAIKMPASLADAPAKPGRALRADERIAKPYDAPVKGGDYRARWAVVIGIDDYSRGAGFKNLDYAVNDAREVRARLHDEFGFTGTEKPTDDQILYLTNEAADRAAIGDALTRWLDSKVLDHRDDAVLVFFAGHGAKDASGRGYLIPSDGRVDDLAGTCVSEVWVRDRLASLKCRHKAVILDSCYSGHLFSDPPEASARVQATSVKVGRTAPSGLLRGTRVGRGLEAIPEASIPTRDNNLAYYLSQPAFLGLSSGRDTPVADGQGENRHSIFTAALLRALDDRADSARWDHSFTFRQLALQVETDVGNTFGSNQVPKSGWLGSEGDGDLVFRPTRWRLTRREILRRERERMAASFAMTHGLSLCEKGEVRLGVLWLAKALETVPPDDPLERAIRINLTAWGRMIYRLVDAYPFADAEFEKKRLEHRPWIMSCAQPDPRFQRDLPQAEGPVLHRTKPTGRTSVHEYVSGVNLDPDSRHLFLNCADGLRIYEFETSRRISPVSGGPVEGSFIGFLADATHFYTCSDSVHFNSSSGGPPALGLWTLSDGHLKNEQMMSLGRGVSILGVSPDGRTAVLEEAQVFRVCNLRTKQMLGNALPFRKMAKEAGPKEAPTYLRGCAYLPGCKFVAVAWEHGVCLLDTTTGLPVGATLIPPEPMESFAISPDGRWLATGEKTLVRIWNLATGKDIRRPLSHDRAVRVRAFAPDSRTLLTETEEDNTLWLWEAVASRPLGVAMAHSGRVRAATFSPDGLSLLTTADDSVIRLWDATTGLAIGAPIVAAGTIMGAGFAGDGKSFWAGHNDGSVCQWDVLSVSATSRRLSPPGPSQRGFALLSLDREVVLIRAQEGARFWDAENGLPLGKDLPRTFQEYITRHEEFRPDLRFFAAPGGSDRSIQLYDSVRAQPVVGEITHPEKIDSVIFAPGNRVVATVSERTIRLWDASTGAAMHAPVLRTQPRAFGVVKFSPDGSRFADSSGATRVWDVETGRPIGPPIPASGSFEFSPDGSKLLISDKSNLREFDVSSGRPTREIASSIGSSGKFVYHPNGKSFLTNYGFRSIRAFDAATGEPISPSLDHSYQSEIVAVSPNGQTVLTSYHADGPEHWEGADRGLLWDLETGTPLGPPLEPLNDFSHARFALDGSEVWADGTYEARIWKVPAPLAGDAMRVNAWASALTGRKLDARGAEVSLTPEEWRSLRRKFALDPGAAADLTREWHADRAHRSERDGHAFAAAWHLERLLEKQPSNGLAWVRLALSRVDAGDTDEARRSLDEALAAHPDRSWLGPLATTYVRLGRYDRANLLAGRLDKSVLLDRATDLNSLLAWSIAFVRAGDADGYRRGCAAILTRYGGRDDLERQSASSILRALLLAPGAVDDWTPAIELSRRVVSDDRWSSDWDLVAAVLYRAGRIDESSAALARSMFEQPNQANNALHEVLKTILNHKTTNSRRSHTSPAITGTQSLSETLESLMIESFLLEVEHQE